MLRINLICVGRLRENYWQQACDEYQKRLTTLCKFTVYEERDDTAIAARLTKENYGHCVAMCVFGRQTSSEDFANQLASLPLSGQSIVTFIIGGAEGLSEQTKTMCHQRISMSKMTFPHQLARVLLTEQIYRALSINGGGKYHK